MVLPSILKTCTRIQRMVLDETISHRMSLRCRLIWIVVCRSKKAREPMSLCDNIGCKYYWHRPCFDFYYRLCPRLLSTKKKSGSSSRKNGDEEKVSISNWVIAVCPSQKKTVAVQLLYVYISNQSQWQSNYVLHVRSAA